MTMTLKMLWVEDDCDKLAATVLPLKKRGWEVVLCTNFQDAITLLDDSFDVFLIDLIIPQIGFDVEEDRVSHGEPRYLGLKLIEMIRDEFGEDRPIVAFSVVHDPMVNRVLDELSVSFRFTKGTNVSNREICESIESTVGTKR